MNTSQSAGSALDFLTELGTPDELRQRAESGAPATRVKVNAHIHLPPNFSAFETVAQAVELAAGEGVGVLGTSNYYDYTVYETFAAEARARGIFPLFGLETIVQLEEVAREGVNINDPGVPGKMYLCGKGITRFGRLPAEGQRIFDVLRQGDAERIARQIAIIAGIFETAGLDTGLDAAAIIQRVAVRHGCAPETVFLQERHAVQAFQEVLFEREPDPEARRSILEAVIATDLEAEPDDLVGIQTALRAQLMKDGKPACVKASLITMEEGRRLILDMGGIPCYPTLADGVKPITPYEEDVEALVSELKARGVYCAELIPLRNEPEVFAHYVRHMRAAGMCVTAGTEHNTLELIPLMPACIRETPIPDDLLDILWEGACVAAAHQFLSAHGECGYVDADGALNPAYSGNEERITSFGKLGAAVIQRYKEIE